MNNFEKQQAITQIITLLTQILNDSTAETTVSAVQEEIPEMLTIKECVKQFSGLTEHAVRQLVLQGKVKSVRTGQGERGKILVIKQDLIHYLNGNA